MIRIFKEAITTGTTGFAGPVLFAVILLRTFGSLEAVFFVKGPVIAAVRAGDTDAVTQIVHHVKDHVRAASTGLIRADLVLAEIADFVRQHRRFGRFIRFVTGIVLIFVGHCRIIAFLRSRIAFCVLRRSSQADASSGLRTAIQAKFLPVDAVPLDAGMDMVTFIVAVLRPCRYSRTGYDADRYQSGDQTPKRGRFHFRLLQSAMAIVKTTLAACTLLTGAVSADTFA